MHKKLLTVAVAGALAAPLAAMADVTVYGTIDTGIRSTSKVCEPPDQTGNLTSRPRRNARRRPACCP